MRGAALFASALACLLAFTGPGSAAGQPQSDQGNSVDADDGKVDIRVWIQVDIPGASEPDTNPADPTTPICHFRHGSYTELNAWLENDFVFAPDPDESYVFKLCETKEGVGLATFWIHQPVPPQEPPPPTVVETTRLRNEAWSSLAIPEPTTHTAPSRATVVHIPTYVWIPAADRTPVSETVTTTLDGHEMSLTATAYPRRLGFLRVDMGDGNTLWCDADDVVAFDPVRDPQDQPSKCFHYYRHSSVDQPGLRYQVVVTAYWDVSVQCVFNGGPCPNPPPAVPTQALTAPPHPIAVAEIQALASPG